VKNDKQISSRSKGPGYRKFHHIKVDQCGFRKNIKNKEDTQSYIFYSILKLLFV